MKVRTLISESAPPKLCEESAQSWVPEFTVLHLALEDGAGPAHVLLCALLSKLAVSKMVKLAEVADSHFQSLFL